jgi:acetyltransferase-like isoleucine patch superfamily enzyme
MSMAMADITCIIRKPDRIWMGQDVRVLEYCWLDIAFDNSHGRYMIMIGEGTTIGMRSTISAANLVSIGKHVLLAPNVFISDTTHHYEDVNIPIIDQPLTTITDSVIIGDGAWIGTNVVINGNVRIGENAVIGANSVVKNDIPAYSVAVGAPARVIKQYNFNTKKWERT